MIPQQSNFQINYFIKEPESSNTFQLVFLGTHQFNQIHKEKKTCINFNEFDHIQAGY